MVGNQRKTNRMIETARIRRAETAGKSFGQLLGWHLLRGTRPGAPRNRAGRRWGSKEFAAAVGVSDRTVRFWLKDQHLPPEIETIERVLFGHNLSSHVEWRLALRHAHASHHKNAPELERREPEATQPAPAPEPRELTLSLLERRPMTVAACKFIGLASRDAKDDPEDVRTATVRLHELAADVVERFGGTVVRVPGDALLIYFGYPEAREDDPERAVRAALELVRTMRRVEVAPPAPQCPRVGIASGTMLVGGIDAPQEWFGEPLNLALALRSAVPSESGVVIASSTHALLGSFFDCEQLAPITLNDDRDTAAAWRVIGESSAVAGRFDALRRAGMVELVGRDEEMELLLRRWQRVQDGAGQVVILTGEAGIGKSRLAVELEARIAPGSDACLKYYGLPHQTNASMFAIIDELQRACGFESSDSASKRLSKLEAVLHAAHVHTAENMALIAALLSLPTDVLPLPNEVRRNLAQMSPQRRKQRIFSALLARTEGLAARRLLLVVAEDLQWIDPTSLEFLALLVERLPRLRVLMLATLRPDPKFSPPWPAHAHVTAVELRRLTDSDAELLVERVAGGKHLPKAVKSQILLPTEGVPLFVEEMTKSVLETGVLRERGGNYELGGSQLQSIPKTLNGSLIARLDRLGRGREIAQIGAVIGRQFSFELLHMLASLDEPKLVDALDELVASGLVFRRGAAPEATFVFKHALVRDAAYAMLPRDRRQALHASVARAYEQGFADTVETQPDLLAYHYVRGAHAAEAIGYLVTAAEQALLRSAAKEALSHLGEAEELISTLPENTDRRKLHLKLEITLGRALLAARGYTARETREAYRRARQRCEVLGDEAPLPLIMHGQWVGAWISGDHESALKHAQDLYSWGKRNKNPVGRTVGHVDVGITLITLGELEQARRHLEEGLKLKRFTLPGQQPFVASDTDGLISALSFMHHCLLLLGFPDQAKAAAQRAAMLKPDNLYSQALAQVRTLRKHVFERDADKTAETADTVLRLSEEQGYPYMAATGKVFRGWAMAQRSKTSRGIEVCESGLSSLRTIGARYWMPFLLTLLAECREQAGDIERAAHAVAEALECVSATGERVWEAEIYRMKGRLLLRAGADEDAAEACFARALAKAREQKAKLLELRAALGLADLLRRKQRAAEGRELVARVYAWFTEGFDSIDLREAKAFLDTVPDQY
jgi:class 3 adenylate cyclase/predicted ATPase